MPAFRAGAHLLAAGLALALLTLVTPAHAGDPYLRWYTVQTPRFHVHYHSGLGQMAQEVATLAETIHQRLQPYLAWQPREITHIILTDDSDGANGSARVQPYNLIRMFVTAPDDMSVLNDYDEWNTELLTHEHVHILHIDNRSGIPDLLNAIFGKAYNPNQVQPRWILEGIATTIESKETSGGRLRSSIFDMYLRADLLENNFARLDQISHSPRRWPSGNVWYLYGGKFIGWILDTYGDDVFAAVAADYGSNVFTWGINRSIRRATGLTYTQLYEGWQAHLRKKYRRMVREVEARGRREGTQLTFGGRGASNPRFAPACAREGKQEEIYYVRGDGHTPNGIYRVPLISRKKADRDNIELVARTANTRAFNFTPECDLVFDDTGPSRRLYYFGDLFMQPVGTKAKRGLSARRRRWTRGRRARYPNVSPDGRRVAYVTNRQGTTTLRIADVETTKDGIRRERRLVPSGRYEQAFTPRFSPDGRKVAYGTWTKGGYRDIRIVDVRTGRIRQVMRDRAIDQQPAWSPDGKTLYFTSDRTGIANVYAYDLRRKKLSMVTNVVNGAYMPEISPDGKTLFYIGYTHEGFDLFSMPLKRSRFLKAPPAKPRPDPPPAPRTKRWPVKHYNPLETLRPTSYEIEVGPGSWGQTAIVSAFGSDAAGLHSVSAEIQAETERADPSASISYAYRQLPVTLRMSAFRRSQPRGGFRFGGEEVTVAERLTGISSGLSFGIPGMFESQSIAVTYSALEIEHELPLSIEADPFSTVTTEPSSGFMGIIRLAYGFSNTQSTTYGISNERGFSFSASGEFASPETGGEDTLALVSGRVTGYMLMPWARHHVLAVGVAGGASGGTYPRRGIFSTGGYVDASVLEAFQEGVLQSRFLLRGYEPGQFRGNLFNLNNLEYRFPLWYADRGVSTLPAFLRTVSAALFVDYGGAFNAVDPERPLQSWQTGVGAELWLDVTLGYAAVATVKLGYQHGLDTDAPSPSMYFVAQSAF